jgi:GNAT superfamily N-acetyltransferase
VIEDASGDPDFVKTLEMALLEDLQATAPQGINSKVALALRTDDGACIAGIYGATSYGWLRVNLIWVDRRHRREGHAKRLMQQAFDLAIDRGCHAAWLETSNSDARDFYRSIGFADFAKLENGADGVPPAHARWFLKARLTHRQ